MRKIRLLSFFLLGLIMFLSIAGCYKNKLKDNGLISEKPCGPPCFLGINIDNSNENDVKSLIETNNYRCQTRFDGRYEYYECQNFFISLKENEVFRIQYGVEGNINLGDIIKKYGNPDYVSLTGPIVPDEKFYIDTLLVFKNFQMLIELPSQNAYFISLSPDSKVKSVIYFNVDTSQFQNSNNDYIWNGYGEYIYNFN